MMKKYVIMVSAILTITCCPMKRSLSTMKDNEIEKYLADMAQEALFKVKKTRAEKVQNFFFPDHSISEQEQKNAQHHVDTVLSIINEEYGTHLQSDFLLAFMRACWDKDGKRIIRFMQYVIQESYCITRSDKKRKNEINKIIALIKQDLQTQQYILTGESMCLRRAITASWQKDMQDAFNATQKYQEEKQKTGGLRLLSSSTL